VEQKKFKKLNLFDLAAARIKNSETAAQVSEGDLIEIIAPFVSNENFLGTVIKVFETTMSIYHADIRKEIIWNRRVNCNVYKV